MRPIARAPLREGGRAEQRAGAAEEGAAREAHRTTQISSAVATANGARPAPSGGTDREGAHPRRRRQAQDLLGRRAGRAAFPAPPRPDHDGILERIEDVEAGEQLGLSILIEIADRELRPGAAHDPAAARAVPELDRAALARRPDREGLALRGQELRRRERVVPAGERRGRRRGSAGAHGPSGP